MTLETLNNYLEDMKARAPYIAEDLQVGVKGAAVRIRNRKYGNTSALVKLEENLVICSSGQPVIPVSRWENELLNAPQGMLLRDATYQVDDDAFVFRTDGHGRVRRINVRLSDHMKKVWERYAWRGRNTNPLLVRGIGTLGPMDGPEEAINLFRVDRKDTQGVIRSLETALSEAIIGCSCFKLVWQADVRYPCPKEIRPCEFRFRAHLMGGAHLRLCVEMDNLVRI